MTMAIAVQGTRPQFPTWIDSNIRRDFVSCPQRMNYSYMMNLRLRGKGIHLHFGGCFAKGLEVFRLSFYWKDKGNFQLALARGAEAIIREWQKPGELDPGQDKKTLDALLDAFLSYWIEWPPRDDAVQPWFDEKGRPAVEFSFALPIPGVFHPVTGEPILYVGRFDMLAQFRKAKFILDDKTATQLGQSWNNQWHLRSQLTGYVWGAREYGHDIAGALVRGCSILKHDIGFQMVIEERSQWFIDRWLDQLRRDMSRMIACWEEGYWDLNLDHACDAYGGCPFQTLCTSKDPTKWIDGINYVQVEPWDPMKETE